MTTNNKLANRDEVLLAFHQAYEKPTAAQIEEWTAKYPEFADDIITHAAISHDWAANASAKADIISQSQYDSAFSQALSAVYEAEREDEDEDLVEGETLRDLMSLCGKDVRAIHREMASVRPIDRGVLADFFNGAMLGPLTNRFASATCDVLDVSLMRLEAAHGRTLLEPPRFGMANAQTTPTIRQRSCADIIRSSEMTEEQKRYWLDEDI